MSTRVVVQGTQIRMEKDGSLREGVSGETIRYIGKGDKDYGKYLKMYLAGGGEDLRK